MVHSRVLVVSLIAGLCVVAVALSVPSATSSASPGSLTSGVPMLAPRSGHTAALLVDGRVLIAGGMRRNQDFYQSAEIFDPTTGKFQPTGDMLVARVGHAAVLLRSGKVLIAGGWIGYAATNEAELYDTATGNFTAIASMVTQRGDPRMTLLSDGNGW